MPVSVNQKRDLDMLKHPERWPHWPFLPMCKGKPGPMATTGLVVDLECGVDDHHAAQPTVYLANIFSLSSVKLSKAEKIEYPTLEAMLADGWWVD
jgi:hypothetical protein